MKSYATSKCIVLCAWIGLAMFMTLADGSETTYSTISSLCVTDCQIGELHVWSMILLPTRGRLLVPVKSRIEIFKRLREVMRVTPHCYSGWHCIPRTLLEREALSATCVSYTKTPECIRATADYNSKLLHSPSYYDPIAQTVFDLHRGMIMLSLKAHMAAVCETPRAIVSVNNEMDKLAASTALCQSILRETDSALVQRLLSVDCFNLFYKPFWTRE